MKTKKQTKGIQYIFIALGIIILMTTLVFFIKYNPINNAKKEINIPDNNITDVITQNGEIISYKYNNYQFEKNQGVWYNQVQMGTQPFIIAYNYGPINVQNLSISFLPNDFQKLTKSGKKIYVTFDHDSSNAPYIATSAINIINNLRTVWGVQSQRACLTNSTNCAGAPVITCENRKENVVIQFIDSENTNIEYKDNCLTIKSSKDDYIKATERIILNWYKIM